MNILLYLQQNIKRQQIQVQVLSVYDLTCMDMYINELRKCPASSLCDAVVFQHENFQLGIVFQRSGKDFFVFVPHARSFQFEAC